MCGCLLLGSCGTIPVPFIHIAALRTALQVRATFRKRLCHLEKYVQIESAHFSDC
jgi:hypothetical protein